MMKNTYITSAVIIITVLNLILLLTEIEMMVNVILVVGLGWMLDNRLKSHHYQALVRNEYYKSLKEEISSMGNTEAETFLISSLTNQEISLLKHDE